VNLSNHLSKHTQVENVSWQRRKWMDETSMTLRESFFL